MKKKNEEQITIKKFIKLLIIILIILGIFYLLSIFIISKDNNSNTYKKNSAEIQNREILGGSSFNRTDDEYLVVFYNRSTNNTVMDAIYNYRNKDTHLPVYEVDMGNGMNSKFNSNTSNKNPSSIDELKIHGTTIIRFKDGKIKEYIEGDSNTVEYLK